MGTDVRPAETPSSGKGVGSEFATPAATADDPAGQFWIALSRGQVQELVQQDAARRGGGQGLLGVVLALSGSRGPVGMEELMRDEGYHDRRASQGLIRSLLVLGAFASGEVYGVNALSDKLGLVTTTTWRYLKTWVALGVLEERQDRRYQLARRWMNQSSAGPVKSPKRRQAR